MSVEGSGSKGLLNYKTVIVLFLAVIVNLVVCVLVWRLDFFVHGDLYQYGLNYSHAWGDRYWNLTYMLWIFLFGATVLAASSIVPHYMHSKKVSRFATWAGFVLPILGIIFEGVSISYLYQKNSMVWNTLSDYGLRYDANWANAYNLMSVPALVLMVVALVALFISAARAVEHEIKM
jgi:tellurite resistance protein TehA-like permease